MIIYDTEIKHRKIDVGNIRKSVSLGKDIIAMLTEIVDIDRELLFEEYYIQTIILFETFFP